MELFAERVNDFKSLTIFTENSILDVVLGSGSACGKFSWNFYQRFQGTYKWLLLSYEE